MTAPEIVVTRAEIAANMRRAVEILRSNGFVRGQMVDDAQQLRTGLHWSFCRMCPRGAFAAAAGQHPRFMIGEGGFRTREAPHQLIRRSEVAFAEYLIRHEMAEPDTMPYRAAFVIEPWADNQWRTLRQVLEAVTAAADELEVAA